MGPKISPSCSRSSVTFPKPQLWKLFGYVGIFLTCWVTCSVSYPVNSHFCSIIVWGHLSNIEALGIHRLNESGWEQKKFFAWILHLFEQLLNIHGMLVFLNTFTIIDLGTYTHTHNHIYKTRWGWGVSIYYPCIKAHIQKSVHPEKGF